MKPILAIVSDLEGFTNDPYINLYVGKLSNYFDIDLIDAQIIGDVTRSQDKELIHKKFVNSGIVLAANRLIKSRIHFDILLGFNTGGAIGWEAIQVGANIDSLITVSTAQFKNEKCGISKPTKFYFGEFEQHIPSEKWLKYLGLDYSIIPNHGDQVYRDETFIRELCTELTDTYSTK
jgi:hypothetical protein